MLVDRVPRREEDDRREERRQQDEPERDAVDAERVVDAPLRNPGGDSTSWKPATPSWKSRRMPSEATNVASEASRPKPLIAFAARLREEERASPRRRWEARGWWRGRWSFPCLGARASRSAAGGRASERRNARVRMPASPDTRLMPAPIRRRSRRGRTSARSCGRCRSGRSGGDRRSRRRRSRGARARPSMRASMPRQRNCEKPSSGRTIVAP